MARNSHEVAAVGRHHPARLRPWRLAWALLLLGLAAALGGCRATGANAAAAGPAPVLLARVQGPIGTTTADYLRRVLNTALREQAQAVVVLLDTPGGTLEATRAIVEMWRGSPVPVVVFVAPRGAQSGSAGALLTLAAHRAYMAPETVIGAATPISVAEADMDPTLQAKFTNIVAAQARGLAERRGPRAAALAEAMVRDARALTAREAVAAGLVDGVVDDVDALLAALDGQVVETVHGPRLLQTREAPRRELEPWPMERLLALLTHPNVVLLLLSVGVQFLIIEFYSPGGWVAGTLGAVLLGLGLYGLGILPTNGLGLWLIGLAFVLFVLEVKAPTHGALAVAGAAAFVAGGWILFNTPLALPQQRLSPWWAALLAGASAGASALGWRLVRQAGQQPVLTGQEEAARLIGRIGWARTDLTPRRRGSVYVAGETWSAVLAPGATAVTAGQPVEVVDRQGLRLVVRGVAAPSAPAAAPAQSEES